MMRFWRLGALLGGAALAMQWLLVAGAAAAETGSPTTLPTNPIVAIVDIDRIMAESAATKSINAQAERYRKSFTEQDGKEEATLHATQQSLEQQRKSLSQEVFAEKLREFDRQVAEVQRMELKRSRAYDRSFNTAMAKVQETMIQAAREVAQAHNANVVVVKRAVLFYDDRMDITAEIIALMNRKLPTTEFPPPKIEADAGPPPGQGAAGSLGGGAQAGGGAGAPGTKLKLQ